MTKTHTISKHDAVCATAKETMFNNMVQIEALSRPFVSHPVDTFPVTFHRAEAKPPIGEYIFGNRQQSLIRDQKALVRIQTIQFTNILAILLFSRNSPCTINGLDCHKSACAILKITLQVAH